MRVVVLLTLIALLGCQRKESAPADPPKGLEPVPRPQLRPGERVDVHGLTVKMLDGGVIELTGKDRWGAPLDTTYENIEFLRNALPVLERSVTPEQAAGLQMLAR